MSVPFFESERSLAEQSNGHCDSQILICKKSCNALDEVIASERQRLLKIMKIIAAVCGVVLLLFRVPIVAEFVMTKTVIDLLCVVCACVAIWIVFVNENLILKKLHVPKQSLETLNSELTQNEHDQIADVELCQGYVEVSDLISMRARSKIRKCLLERYL